jgi:hypothetical protein
MFVVIRNIPYSRLDKAGLSTPEGAVGVCKSFYVVLYRSVVRAHYRVHNI